MVKGSHRTSKKLIASVMTSHTKIEKPVQFFSLQATSEFASRSSSVFGDLSVLENKHETWMTDNETIEPFEKQSVADPIQTEIEVFKKPFIPPPSKRKRFSKRNVKKWIKYSLEDVPLSSDATNKAVAFQFLRDLRREKELAEAKDYPDGKIKFCRPLKKKKCTKSYVSASLVSTSSDNDISAVDSTIAKSEINEEKKETNIKLGHLDEEFEDD